MTYAILYDRVSDESRQKDNFAPEDRQRLMVEYAKSQGWQYEIVFETEGASQYSKGMNRTKLKTILERADRKEFDVLVYFQADRFTRDLADGILLRRTMYRAKIKLYVCYPSPREILFDQELLNIIEDYQSESYVRTLRANTMRGYQQKVKAGKFSNGLAPYGYQLVGKKQDTYLELHPEHSAVVKSIFDWYNSGKSTGEIADLLKGIPTPGEFTNKSRKRKSGEWTPNAVRKVLRNDVYKGTWYAKYKMIDGKAVLKDKTELIPVNIPALIDEDTWNAAQRRHSPERSNRKRWYMLTGLLRCGTCNAPMSAEKRKNKTGERIYYTCAGDQLANKKACGVYYRTDIVDSLVWQMTIGYIEHPEHLKYALEQHEETSGNGSAVLQEEIIKRQAMVQELVTLYAQTSNAFVKQSIEKEINSHGEIIETLQGKINAIQGEYKTRADQRRAILQTIELMEALKEEIHDITETQERKKILQMLHFLIVLSKNDGQKLVTVYFSESGEKNLKGLPLALSTQRLKLAEIKIDTPSNTR